MNIFHGTILGGNADDYDDDDVHLIEGQPEHLPRNNGSLSEGSSPEVGGITARDTRISWMSSLFVKYLFTNKSKSFGISILMEWIVIDHELLIIFVNLVGGSFM